MKATLLVFLLLAACGPTDVGGSVCENPCFASVTAEFEGLECARFDRDVEIAKEIFNSYGLLPAEEFCETFTDVTIVLRAEGTYFYSGATRVTGVSYFGGLIELTQDGLSLAHELLHDLDDKKGVSEQDNYDHKDWLAKNYYPASWEYKDKAYSLDPANYEDEPLDQPLPKKK